MSTPTNPPGVDGNTPRPPTNYALPTWAIAEAARLLRGKAQDLDLHGHFVAICTGCLDGERGECATPGCLFLGRLRGAAIRRRAEAQDGEHIARALVAARLDGVKAGLEAAGVAALSAQLPNVYVWGHDAMEQFNFGKKRSEAAIRAIDPAKVGVE